MNLTTIHRIISLAVLLLLSLNSTCQNGPTPPSVQLSWTQSTSSGVTANCVYRGAAAGVYVLPALFCSTAPTVSYTDLTVTRGSTYHYAVTAQIGAQESGYSNDVTAIIPPTIPPPVPKPPVETRLIPEPDQDQNHDQRQVASHRPGSAGPAVLVAKVHPGHD